MSNTPYIFSSTKISRYLIDEMIQTSDNVFDFIINQKVNELILKSSQSSLSFSKMNKFVFNIREFNLMNFNTLINLDILLSYGLKGKSITALHRNYKNISELYNDYSRLKLDMGFKTNFKISEAMGLFMEDMNTNKSYLKEIILFLLLVNKKVNKNEFRDIFFNHVKKYYPFITVNDDDFLQSIEQLKMDDYLFFDDDNIVFPPNIYYSVDVNSDCRKSFKYYLNFDFVYKDIVKKRIQGMTLADIGKQTNQTRERVRQIQNSLAFIFNETKEFLEFKNIFEKYKIDIDDFKNIFSEKDETYYFLQFMCTRGSEKLSYDEALQDPLFHKLEYSRVNLDYLKDSENERQDSSNASGKTNHGMTKKEAVQEFLKQHSEVKFNAHDFLIAYNNYYDDKLRLNSENSVLGKVSLLKDAISGSNKTFRFFNFSEKEKIAFYIYDIMNQYVNGEYSTYKVFIENPVLMEKLDVRDEYELHNFIKRNEDKFYGFNLAKSPMILKGFDSKKQFVEHELSISSGMTEEDFVSKIFTEYGLKKSSFRAYLDVTFKKNIYDGKILDLDKDFDSEFINSTKEKITDDVYKVSEFCDLVNIDESFISNELLHVISYYQRGDFLFSSRFDSLTSAVQNMIFEGSTKLYEIYDDQTIKRIIFNLLSNKKIFELGNDKLFTIDNLKQKGFSEIDIDNFIDKVCRVTKNKKYFSIESIYDELNGDKLFDYSFMEAFYDSIIGYSGKFTVLRRNFNNDLRLYTNGEGNLADFIRIELELIGGKSYMNDYLDHINEKYGLNLSENLVQKNVEKYANALDKIYNNKIDYYKDIE